MPTLAIMCSGIGLVNRGFESFAYELFSELKKQDSVKVILIKGGGVSTDQEIRARCFSRFNFLAQKLSKILRKSPYWIEQSSFTLTSYLILRSIKPDIILFSDGHIGNLLWRVRKYLPSKPKLVFSNGAPFPPPYDRWDHVHQVTPSYLEEGVKSGYSVSRQSVIPYGVNTSTEQSLINFEERQVLRQKLRIPNDKKVLLCVAALNYSHKRLDYLINEIASIKEERPFLIIIGEESEESNKIKELASLKLPSDSYIIKSVSRDEVSDYYKTANIFTLPSLHEGFGKVLIEAMSFGLPCLVHDYDVTRFVLESHGVYGDLTKEGELVQLFNEVINHPDTEEQKKNRMHFVAKKYSWNVLREKYIDMFVRVTNETDKFH